MKWVAYCIIITVEPMPEGHSPHTHTRLCRRIITTSTQVHSYTYTSSWTGSQRLWWHHTGVGWRISPFLTENGFLNGRLARNRKIHKQMDSVQSVILINFSHRASPFLGKMGWILFIEIHYNLGINSDLQIKSLYCSIRQNHIEEIFGLRSSWAKLSNDYLKCQFCQEKPIQVITKATTYSNLVFL